MLLDSTQARSFLAVSFRFAITAEKRVVGRPRRSGKERDKTRRNQTGREDGEGGVSFSCCEYRRRGFQSTCLSDRKAKNSMEKEAI
jgi:hypothetical protein